MLLLRKRTAKLVLRREKEHGRYGDCLQDPASHIVESKHFCLSAIASKIYKRLDAVMSLPDQAIGKIACI